jgi:RNA polymerase-interacting CarD/CdnL/TRCF family regulator
MGNPELARGAFIMFKKGEIVMHPNYGAGMVIDIKGITVDGHKRCYYHVDLVDGERFLMIPVDEAETIGLGLIVDSANLLDVLRSAPIELDKDYRQRQARLAEKIYSGDPEQVAEALRDLAWRKRTAKLSIRDGILLRKAKRLLASVFALRRSDRDFDKARSRLSRILLQNIQQQEAAGMMPN